MRKLFLVCATAAAMLVAGALSAPRAEAMPLSSGAAGLNTTLAEGGLMQDVAYVCRRVWRCGPYGCGWRRSCWWSGPRYYGPLYYGGWRGGYYRSYPYRYNRWHRRYRY